MDVFSQQNPPNAKKERRYTTAISSFLCFVYNILYFPSIIYALIIYHIPASPNCYKSAQILEKEPISFPHCGFVLCLLILVFLHLYF